MRKSIFLISLISIVGIISCNKGDNRPPTSGIFRGVFSRILPGGDTSGTGVVHLALFEKELRYQMTGDKNSNAPYSCAGIYTFPSENQIEFHSLSNVPEEETELFYNPFYVLDTIYNFEFTDTSLYLKFEGDDIDYIYNLIPV